MRVVYTMYNVPCMEHCVDGTPCMGHSKCMLIESTIYNWLTASAPAALFMMRDIDTDKCTYEFRGASCSCRTIHRCEHTEHIRGIHVAHADNMV